MLPFALDAEQQEDVVQQLCAAIENYFDNSRIRRLPDRIAFFLRPDCGMVNIKLLGPKLSRELGAISLSNIESRYYALPQTENVDFETEHARLMQSMRDWIRCALMSDDLNSKLVSLLKLHLLAPTTIDYDDLETERLIELTS